MTDIPKVWYEENKDGRRYWCNVHGRYATHIRYSSAHPPVKCCAPGQSGVAMPCVSIVDVTDELEIFEDDKN